MTAQREEHVLSPKKLQEEEENLQIKINSKGLSANPSVWPLIWILIQTDKFVNTKTSMRQFEQKTLNSGGNNETRLTKS